MGVPRSQPESPSASRRLPRAERRAQLLETARRIVREKGTDALTLGHLAERAGVTKPITYQHFESRAGLLIALYEQIDTQQVAMLRAALDKTRARLVDVARVISRASIACYEEVGLDALAITAALKGDEAMERAERAIYARYVAIYCEALAPHTRLDARALEVRCVALLGAGDALAREMLRGELDATTAAATLQSLIVRWLGTQPRR